MSNPNANDYKYWAFISYSHQDNLATRGDGSGDHIQWANWLHEQLETYRVPDGYRDRTTATDEPMPERFFPTFRDEAELPTSHDLGGQIHDALRRSRFLIVIASPRSAASRYVNEEVRYFRQLGRGNRILTLIIDGEPNVRLSPKTGWSADDDCFGPALVHPLRNDGSMNETASLPEEPIAADVRVKEAEPPREMRASERAHADRQGLLDFMKLKLIAGLMGVGLDELVQRDKRRAEEQLKRSRQELSRTEFLFARQLLDLKDYPKAYAHLAKSIADDPENRAASTLGLEELRGRVNRGFLRQQVLYKGEVIFAVFCPDGARILTAFNDHTARIWDAATGRPLADPLRHSDWVRSAVFSPDGTQILTTSDDNTARLWDTATGRPLAMPLRHEKRIESAVFSPDGTQILTASDDHTARLWDTATGRSLIEPLRHTNWVRSALFSPDGARIMTRAFQETARLWDAASGCPLVELAYEDMYSDVFGIRLHSAVFSPDGTRILTVSESDYHTYTVRLWDTATGRVLAEPLRHEGEVCNAVFSPDGARILATSDDNVHLWDAATGRPLAEPLPHGGKVDHAVFSPDGARILTASDDNVYLWDAANEIRDFEDVTILRSLLEIGGNHRLNAYSFMEPVPSDAVGQIRGEMDATDVVCKPLCWWWADPFSRTIHPSSAITVPEFVRHRIGEVLDAPGARAKTYALQDALNAFPHHPLVLLCLVEQGNHGDPAWLAQHAVSRLLTEPHYLTPIQSRMTDADHAARAYELKEGLAEDCYLGARLLQRQKRPALAKQVIARACKLVPANKTYQQFASQL